MGQSMKTLTKLLILSFTVFVFGCSTNNAKKDDPYVNLSAKEIYDKGHTQWKKGSYEQALKDFRGLDTHFPYGAYTEQAQLESVYVNFLFEDYPAAIASADRFIRLHPRHPNLDYVYYMRGIVRYSENIGFLQRNLPIRHEIRDVTPDRDAFVMFTELVKRFPNSKYSADARQRMIYLRNTLASHELHVAEFYMHRKAYIAAANRAQYIVKNFNETPETPKALALMADAYQHLQMDDLAKDALKVLSYNYPKQAPALTTHLAEARTEAFEKTPPVADAITKPAPLLTTPLNTSPVLASSKNAPDKDES
jgi:outer membrane protein assembly factor BamD